MAYNVNLTITVTLGKEKVKDESKKEVKQKYDRPQLALTGILTSKVSLQM